MPRYFVWNKVTMTAHDLIRCLLTVASSAQCVHKSHKQIEICCAGYNLQIHKTDHITSLLIWYTLRSILIIKPWSQMADGINLLSSLHCREWDRCLTSQAYEGHTNRHALLPWTALCIETFFKFPHMNYHGMTCLVLCSKMLHKIGYMNLYCM